MAKSVNYWKLPESREIINMNFIFLYYQFFTNFGFQLIL